MTQEQTSPGLQNERTALAWQRTALSLLAAAAAVARLTYEELGTWSLLCLLLTLPFGAWVFRESRRRYRNSAAPHQRSGRGGRAAMCACVMIVVIGGLELATIIGQSPL